MVPGQDGKRRLTELPTGAGDPRVIPTGDVEVQGAAFFPDGRTILEFGNAAGANGQRLWVQDANGGKPRPISPEGVDVHIAGSISPDGKRVAAADPDGKIAIYSVDGGEPAAVAGTTPQDRAVRWMPDGKSLLVAVVDAPNLVYEVEVGTGKRKLFRTIPVPDGASKAMYTLLGRSSRTFMWWRD